MQTHFDLNALARPEIRTADEILRKCVHCGFCTATCPTYVLTGDERDSPRGRIWMMRDLLGGSDKQTEIKLNLSLFIAAPKKITHHPYTTPWTVTFITCQNIGWTCSGAKATMHAFS